MVVGGRGPESHRGSKVCAEAQGGGGGCGMRPPRLHLSHWGVGSGFPGIFCPGSLALPCILRPRLWKKTFFPSWGLENEVGRGFMPLLPPQKDRSHQSAVAKAIRNFPDENSLREKRGTSGEVDPGGKGL